MCDDNVNLRVSVNNLDITPPLSLLTLSQPTDMLSPILLSQSRGSEERSKTHNINCNTSANLVLLLSLMGASDQRLPIIMSTTGTQVLIIGTYIITLVAVPTKM